MSDKKLIDLQIWKTPGNFFTVMLGNSRVAGNELRAEWAVVYKGKLDIEELKQAIEEVENKKPT